MVQLLYKSVFYSIRDSVSRTILPIRSLVFFFYATFLTQRSNQRYYTLSLTRDNDAIRPVVVAKIHISSWLVSICSMSTVLIS